MPTRWPAAVTCCWLTRMSVAFLGSLAMAESLDVEAHLRRGGLGDREIAEVRARLVG